MGIASVVVNIFVLEITHHCSKYNTWMVAEWMRKLPTFVTHLSPNSGPWDNEEQQFVSHLFRELATKGNVKTVEKSLR